MKITSVNLPKSYSGSSGLEEISLQRLGKIVLLAGVNGAGKTRLLSALESASRQEMIGYTNNVIRELEESQRREITGLRNEIRHSERRLSNARQELERKQNEGWTRIEDESLSEDERKQAHEHEIQHAIASIEEDQRRLDRLKTEQPAEDERINQEFNQEIKNTKPLVGFEGGECEVTRLRIFSGTEYQGYFKNVARDHREARHPDTDAIQKQQWNDEYKKLRRITCEAWGSSGEVFTEDKGQAYINGLELGREGLSGGQLILLNSKLHLEDITFITQGRIYLLDEPENHLHPKALIEMLEAIESKLADGQLWIATHSVHLLAHYMQRNDASLVFMENGRATFAGNAPERVLTSLMGGKDEIENLADFTASPAQYAAIRFAAECIIPPDAIMTKGDDPQNQLISERLGKEGGSILDYGAGRGRLLANLYDSNDDKEGFKERFTYYAWDHCDVGAEPRYKAECEGIISDIYGNDPQRYFYPGNEPTELAVDVVLMCNVLHEIDPSLWLGIFAPQGVLMRSLKEGGRLLIVEDMCLPVGEKAYEEGFLVLGAEALKILFSYKQLNECSSSNPAYTDRLKCFEIPKGALLNISEDSIRQAIECVYDLSMEMLTTTPLSAGYKDGKKRAFWVHQLANAALLLRKYDATCKGNERKQAAVR